MSFALLFSHNVLGFEKRWCIHAFAEVWKRRALTLSFFPHCKLLRTVDEVGQPGRESKIAPRSAREKGAQRSSQNSSRRWCWLRVVCCKTQGMVCHHFPLHSTWVHTIPRCFKEFRGSDASWWREDWSWEVLEDFFAVFFVVAELGSKSLVVCWCFCFAAVPCMFLFEESVPTLQICSAPVQCKSDPFNLIGKVCWESYIHMQCRFVHPVKNELQVCIFFPFLVAASFILCILYSAGNLFYPHADLFSTSPIQEWSIQFDWESVLGILYTTCRFVATVKMNCRCASFFHFLLLHRCSSCACASCGIIQFLQSFYYLLSFCFATNAVSVEKFGVAICEPINLCPVWNPIPWHR